MTLKTLSSQLAGIQLICAEHREKNVLMALDNKKSVQ